MKLIKVEDAQTGQRVSKDVTDLKGVLLFRAGTALTEDALRQIRQRNITHLFVDVDSGPAGSPSSGIFKSPDQVDRELETLFGDARSQPLMSALFEAAKRYHKTRIK